MSNGTCLTGVSLSPAPGLHSALAVANEEGIVRLYNTESRENPVLKGMCVVTSRFHTCAVCHWEMSVQ